jgi:hypothetical protein
MRVNRLENENHSNYTELVLKCNQQNQSYRTNKIMEKVRVKFA